MVSQERSSQTENQYVGNHRLFSIKLDGALKFLSSLLLPLVLGVFTSVITIQQQKSSELQREMDRISSTEQLAQERNLTKEKYRNEIFDNYIKDISELLEKNNGSLTNDKTTASIARVKTLNVLRRLDAERNIQVIRFIYEAGQLNSAQDQLPLDLSSAKLIDMVFREAAIDEKKLDFLSLANILLYNVTFAELEMEGSDFAKTKFQEANFSLCQMTANFEKARLDNIEFFNTSFNSNSFQSSVLNKVNFSYSTWNSTNFGQARLDDIDCFNTTFNADSFPLVIFNKGNFSYATFNKANYENARLNNIQFFNVTFNAATFHLAKLETVNFRFARFITHTSSNPEMNMQVDFTNTTLNKIDFSFASILKANFKYAILENVNYSYCALFEVYFSVVPRMLNINFSNSFLHKVDIFSIATIKNIDFSHSQLALLTIPDDGMLEANFVSVTLSDTDFVLSRLENASFSSAIVVRSSFARTNIINSDFRQVTCIATHFNDAFIYDSDFENSNLKYASFMNSALETVNIAGSNLYKANLMDALMSDRQLQSALSIQDAVLPNGTVANDRNLIENGGVDCNAPIGKHWTLINGNVNISISDIDAANCYFSLESSGTGAAMFQRVNLFSKWDSIMWPYSKAVLTAQMGMGVFLLLKGIDSTDQIVTQSTLYESNGNINIVLHNTMQQLEVFINFTSIANQTLTGIPWCDNIRLFIIYGNYKELIRIIPNLPVHALWDQNGTKTAGGNGFGRNNSQLADPFGLVVDDDNDQMITIVEQSNHRVCQWRKGATSGQVVAGGNGRGNRSDQLNAPTDVLIDKETHSFMIADHFNHRVVQWSLLGGTKQGKVLISNIGCFGLAMDEHRNLYVSNFVKDEIRRYEIDRNDNKGTLIAGGNGKGMALNQLDNPTYIFVNRHQSIYVSDKENHRVMKWGKSATQGNVVAGGQGEGNDLTQLSYPYGILVDSLDTVYVAEAGNGRVTRWPKGSQKSTVVAGGNGRGSDANQLRELRALSFDKYGNLYVVDSGNDRVQRFNITS